MNIYHGSNLSVVNPRIILPDKKRLTDFGNGFYTTSSVEQAKKFVPMVVRRINNGEPTISSYEFDFKKAVNDLSIKQFKGASEEWLDFVIANRRNFPVEQYDVVIGPVADDQVLPTIVQLELGAFSKEAALVALKTSVFVDQIVFKTERALEYLTFLESEVL